MSLFRRNKNKHRHAHYYKGLQHLQWERGYPETLILFRCSCGDSYTKTKQGIWTAEQLGYDQSARTGHMSFYSQTLPPFPATEAVSPCHQGQQQSCESAPQTRMDTGI